MTARDTLPALEGTMSNDDEPWVIYKPGFGYYKPGCCGYTAHLHRAGRFIRREAERHRQDESHLPGGQVVTPMPISQAQRVNVPSELDQAARDAALLARERAAWIAETCGAPEVARRIRNDRPGDTSE